MKPIIFNPAFKSSKVPLGANLVNEEIILNLFITKDYQMTKVTLVIEDDYQNISKDLELSLKEQGDYNCYHCQYKMENPGHYWYYFVVFDVYGKHYIIPNEALSALLSDKLNNKWFLGIHQAYLYQTKWPLGKVIYQIMPDRFFKDPNYQHENKRDIIIHENWQDTPLGGENIGRDFFGGNLAGITAKLAYLKSLGIGIIYLNPIFEAASNHKYDTGDYLKIDQSFGTLEDLQTLIGEAKKSDIAIIFDGVFNHTGSDSRYFNKEGHYPTLGAYQGKNSIYYSWYQFINYPDEYHSWWGFKSLPSVNQKDSSYLEFITGKNGVLEKWLSLGLKGVRLDVIDELSDDFLERIFQKTKEIDTENFIIGEVWENAAIKCAYDKRRNYFNGRQLDSVMNYPLKKAIITYVMQANSTPLRNTLRAQISHYPVYILNRLMNILGTHDTKRLMTTLLGPEQRNSEEVINYLKLATIMQYTLPGIPCLYYGDEIGLEGGKDPFCRGTFRWERINSELTKWYQLLGEIRQNEVFREGEYSEEYVSGGVFVYSRQTTKQKIVVIINRSNSDYSYFLAEGEELITKNKVRGNFVIKKNNGAIIKITS